ncbi:YtxH domain-containing protein [Alkalihalophilus lindianensis]|uniref:YtxH domain-containing protein n=1 Tax=Alkalihalophilus lindianensis TaxID=1630542 RepID=A0ABU3XBH8_9BACI|nr:YtxH domain-containing protein [Alkalihalophilus lindianensis]MDV2685234.1 YtxH domain-containing protein [Alkalihalophilus lindianensis]
MFKKKRSSRSGYLMGTIVGGMVGVAGYYLLATDKGNHLRKDLVNKMPERSGSKGALSHLLLEFGSEWSEDIKEVLGESKNPQHREVAKKETIDNQRKSDIGELIQGVLEEE